MNQHVQELMNYSWASALLEGEGSITITKNKKNYYQLSIVIENTDKILVDTFHNIFPQGTIYYPKQRENRKKIYRYTANNSNASEILRTLYPFLLAKKDQAALGLSFAGTLGQRGQSRSVKDELIQEHCYKKMKQLKRDGDIDDMIGGNSFEYEREDDMGSQTTNL